MLKLLNKIDENKLILKYAQTPIGKVIVVFVYAILMINTPLYPVTWQQDIIIIVSIITFFPRYRHLLIFIGMLTLMSQNLLFKPQQDWIIFKVNYLYYMFKNGYQNYITPTQLKYLQISILIIFSELIIFITYRFNKYRIMKYPIAISYMLILILILIACYAPLNPLHVFLLWSFIIAYNHYFWFIGYTIIERKFLEKRNYLLDYGRYLPIWGFTTLPYGKGSIYLHQVESKTQIDFSITQIKAIKLAFWAFLLHFLLNFMHYGEAYLNIPSLPSALHDYANGKHYTIYQAWICLLNRFFRMMLELTVTGHLVVSTCRICGFKILRNTYKPLQSTTVAEFWNRYNFYFKELLAEFFFYPTYFRFFKTMPRFRIFFATLSSATFGNILFHFLLITPIIMGNGFMEGCRGFIQFILYACILGISIGASQLRNQFYKKKSSKLMNYLISPVLVLSFYSILGLFNQTYQHENIIINFKFLLSLFNLNGVL
jgi:hypothetical protein